MNGHRLVILKLIWGRIKYQIQIKERIIAKVIKVFYLILKEIQIHSYKYLLPYQLNNRLFKEKNIPHNTKRQKKQIFQFRVL